jgi:Family of unknown function (DUF5652)
MYNLYGSSFFNIIILILAVWTIPWKGYALWIAAKRNQKIWFIVILILNTVGILEIFYIFKIAKKSWPEVDADLRSLKDLFKKKDPEVNQ